MCYQLSLRSLFYLFLSGQFTQVIQGAQWLSGRVLDSRQRGCVFEPHQHHCVVSLSNNINPSLVLVQPRKTHPFKTERLLMGRKESNQTNKIHSFNCIKEILILVTQCQVSPSGGWFFSSFLIFALEHSISM